MNVIFLDFDGVIDTIHLKSNEEVEKKIALLAEICHEFDCKVVISASAKAGFDFEKGTQENEWCTFIYNTFIKYGIDCIGKTPNVDKWFSRFEYKEGWREYEILKYLREHPEIEHFVVIDDNDSDDLTLLYDHLVETVYCNSENYEEEGLLPRHKEEIKKILALGKKRKRTN